MGHFGFDFHLEWTENLKKIGNNCRYYIGKHHRQYIRERFKFFLEVRTPTIRHQDAVRQEERCIGDAKSEKGVGIGCTQSNS